MKGYIKKARITILYTGPLGRQVETERSERSQHGMRLLRNGGESIIVQGGLNEVPRPDILFTVVSKVLVISQRLTLFRV